MNKKPAAVMKGAEMIYRITNRENGVLLLHGFTGNSHELAYLADKISAAGYSVYVPRYPGHGTTVEEMSRSHVEDWFAAAREAYLELKAQCTNVYVAGLSMGGLFSILLAREFDIPKIVLMSTPAAIPDKTIYLTPLLRHFIKVIYSSEEKIKNDKKGINNPVDRAQHVNYNTGMPVGQTWELHCMIKKAMKSLRYFKSPVLVIQSHGDTVIPPWSLEFILSHIHSEKKESMWLDRSNHVIAYDFDKDAVAARVLEFFRA